MKDLFHTPWAASIVIIASSVHAGELQPQIVGQESEYQLLIQKEMANRSIDELVLLKPPQMSDEAFQRKIEAKAYFDSVHSTPGYPSIQNFHKFLVRENMGLPVSPDFFVYSAAAPFSNTQLWAEKSEANQAMLQFWQQRNEALGLSAKGEFKIPSELFKTRSPGNTENLYKNSNYAFSTPYAPGTGGRFTTAELERKRDEAKDCLGQQTISSALSSADREAVFRCFEKFDVALYKKMGYENKDGLKLYQALKYVSTIVNNDGTHECMASIYKENLWITAKHCLIESKIDNGIYLLIGDSRIKITRDNSRHCSIYPCDISMIRAPTPAFSNDLVVNALNDKTLNIRTPLLIPGIEAGSPDYVNGKNITQTNLMWSHVGKGYCNVYKVEDSCISHTCSSLSGFSGAPIYAQDQQNNIRLVGIHSGDLQDLVRCSSKRTNYASSSALFPDFNNYSGTYIAKQKVVAGKLKLEDCEACSPHALESFKLNQPSRP